MSHYPSLPATDPDQLTRKALASDQDLRWCPGCGDYSILANIQRVLPTLGIPRENFVFISGIGCAARFPYYMETYGMHSIHGRAPAIASGIKCLRPELSVWVISGDGDALSIGGNHLIHAVRRNIDLNILVFNNRIYGLTKGQYSPTSELGKRTKSSPMGSLDHPFNPINLVLGAGASFVARTVDVDAKHLRSVLCRAAAHRGTSLVEIMQNCVIFNDGAWEHVSDRRQRIHNELQLEHGAPLRFGPGQSKGIMLRNAEPQVVEVDEVGAGALLVHDERNMALAHLLATLEHPAYPTPVGVFRQVDRPVYDQGMAAQLDVAVERAGGRGRVQDLLDAGQTWTVE